MQLPQNETQGTDSYFLPAGHFPDTCFGRLALFKSFSVSVQGPKRAREIARRPKQRDLLDEVVARVALRIALWRSDLPDDVTASITAGHSFL
jgi:hypothetical protein